MAFLDSTAVNVALPAMGDDLGASFGGLQWIINAYLLALASLVLPGGTLGDRWGRRLSVAGSSTLPLAAGISGIERAGGAALSEGFGRAMWIGAALLVVSACVAWLTVHVSISEARQGS